MKNNIWLLLFVSRMHILCPVNSDFIKSLRSYDPAKDVGLPYGQSGFRGYPSPRRVETKRPVSNSMSRYAAKIREEVDARIATPVTSQSRRNAIVDVEEKRKFHLMHAQHRYDYAKIAQRPWISPRVKPEDIKAQAKNLKSFIQRFEEIRALRLYNQQETTP